MTEPKEGNNVLYRLLPIAASILFLVYLFILLRSRRMKQTYVYIWFLIGIGLLVISIWPQVVFLVSQALGFKRASNMILVIACVVLLMVTIQLSTAVSRLEEDRRRLAEEIALLRAERAAPPAEA
ncbi:MULTISPECIES: DUF2304 domain-containing protein [Actinomycetaceae]|uniref:DUF2304 domain-containing protein n=1 Tax=Actinotignum timonense TaxID=1870995 RepID=A0AAW9HMK7_9ACTO|nr:MULTISPECIES: DUF2304 domain-containing protein [Actinotignum]MDE1537043.1 DUF2304 domain-containing protein [Actinotignum schaalii]MDE1558258.1 DUF2304 domain-containing protein [Actinotignum schaalii]MDE1663786.1 DUF2304 domain-containing protein [Actinotignum schaalii]MDK6372799.1 DUF2304 domain-containing protein [Actinotignum timonense]MDK6419237.1 DUF2304 domain-containing protein [Actinotignum timonense]